MLAELTATDKQPNLVTHDGRIETHHSLLTTNNTKNTKELSLMPSSLIFVVFVVDIC